jgi:hypothetical protein
MAVRAAFSMPAKPDLGREFRLPVNEVTTAM